MRLHRDVVALYNYMSQILVELIKLANLIITITKALACAGRIESVFDVTSGMADGSVKEAVAKEEQPGVEFKNVSLTYSGSGAPSVEGINFKAMKGQTIGVIGGTKVQVNPVLLILSRDCMTLHRVKYLLMV